VFDTIPAWVDGIVDCLITVDMCCVSKNKFSMLHTTFLERVEHTQHAEHITQHSRANATDRVGYPEGNLAHCQQRFEDSQCGADDVAPAHGWPRT
jgi:hypothetical protein